MSAAANTEGLYRAASPASLCVGCGADSIGRCARCQLPLCSEHMHRDNERCMACEAQYNSHWLPRMFGHKKARKRREYVFAAITVVMVLCIWAMVVLLSKRSGTVKLLELLRFAPYLVICLPVLALPLKRRRFLAEVVAHQPGKPSTLGFVADLMHRPRCAECDEPSAAQCKRCSAWACYQHRSDGLCNSCKKEFAAFWKQCRARRWAMGVAVSGGVLSLALFVRLIATTSGHTVHVSAMVPILVAMGLPLPSMLVGLKRAQNQFLRQEHAS